MPDVLTPLVTAVAVGGLVVALGGLALLVLDRRLGRDGVGVAVLFTTAGVEVLTVVHGVVVLVALVVGDEPRRTGVVVLYVLAVVLTLPLGVLWALGDSSRASGGVLSIAGLGHAAFVGRLAQVWEE